MDNLSVTSRLLRLTSTVGILAYCLALHTESRPLLPALILLAALCVGIHAIFMAGRRLGRILCTIIGRRPVTSAVLTLAIGLAKV